MGLFDFLKGGNKGGGAGGRSGSTSDERALMRHAERVMDKRAMSPDRFGSIEFLARQSTAEAWRALLPRFNFNVDPTITDREEKQYIFEAITGNPENAVEPVREYLRTAPSLAWPIKMLKSMVPREELVGDLLGMLSKFDTGYEKNTERKVQTILALEEEPDPRVPGAVMQFLEDFNEDTRFHSVRTLVAQGDEAAREPLLKLLLADESVRIRTTVVEGLAERGWPIDPDQRDKIASLLQTVPTGPYVISKDLKITAAKRL